MEFLGRNSPSSDANGARPFACPYEDCNEAFWTEKALTQHKIANDEHLYCRDCDVDCKDWEAFHKHKVESTEHICCPACGMDFGSTGGMKRHIRIDHKKPSPVRCVACKETFPSGGAFVQHFEHDRCRNSQDPSAGVRKEVFEANWERKVQVRDLRNRPRMSVHSIVSKDAESTAAKSPRQMNSQNYLGDIEENSATIVPSMSPTTGSVTDVTTSSSWEDEERQDIKLTRTEAFHKGIERLNLEHDAEDTDRGFSSLQQSAEETPWKADIPTSASSTQQEIRQPGKYFPKLNPAAFYDKILQHYRCPFRVCKFITKDGSKLEKHVVDCGFQPKSLQCPGCFHLFKSNHAMVQHMSMATERCHIQYSKDYAKVLDHFSGGFLDVRKSDGKGHKIYSAGKPEGFW